MFVGVKKGLNEDGTFSNVNEEGVGGPTANELDERGRDAVFRERSGSTCSHGLTSDIILEKPIESGDEKVVCWDGAFGSKPKWSL